MYRAGNTNCIAFVPHEIDRWAGLAVIYTCDEDAHNGFGPIMIVNPDLTQRLAPAMAAHMSKYTGE